MLTGTLSPVKAAVREADITLTQASPRIAMLSLGEGLDVSSLGPGHRGNDCAWVGHTGDD